MAQRGSPRGDVRAKDDSRVAQARDRFEDAHRNQTLAQFEHAHLALVRPSVWRARVLAIRVLARRRVSKIFRRERAVSINSD